MIHKIGGGAGSVEKAGTLQKDLDRLGEWAEKWQMEYSVAKCGVMHFGSWNKGIVYFLNGVIIQKLEVQMDLGVLVQDFQKVNLQVK